MKKSFSERSTEIWPQKLTLKFAIFQFLKTLTQKVLQDIKKSFEYANWCTKIYRIFPDTLWNTTTVTLLIYKICMQLWSEENFWFMTSSKMRMPFFQGFFSELFPKVCVKSEGNPWTESKICSLNIWEVATELRDSCKLNFGILTLKEKVVVGKNCPIFFEHF